MLDPIKNMNETFSSKKIEETKLSNEENYEIQALNNAFDNLKATHDNVL